MTSKQQRGEESGSGRYNADMSKGELSLRGSVSVSVFRIRCAFKVFTDF